MRTTHAIALVLCLLIAAWGQPTAQAQWMSGGNLITGANDQGSPRLVTDGAGGAIILFESGWAGSDSDLRIQRIDVGGSLRWAAGGEAICTEDGDQIWADLVADGAGGAIMTWSDARISSTYQVYVQRIDSAGAIQWDIDGRQVNYGASQSRIALDGAGGFFLSWVEAATYPTSIVVQRLTSDGWYSWPDYVTVGGTQAPRVVSDGAGGVVTGWRGYASPTLGYYVRGQRLNASGVEQWPSVAVSPSHGCYFEAQIASDGAGGGIWVWSDVGGLVAQRVDGSGDFQWGPDGVRPFPDVPFSNARSEQVISDGAGGAILVTENGALEADLYMNRILADGTLAWSNGVLICDAVEWQQSPQLAPDGHGGAYVVWRDNRDWATNQNDIYAQHVSAGGAPQWGPNGIRISPAAGNQIDPQITATGDDSAIVAWQDDRNGATNLDIYAQALHYDGSIGDPRLEVVAVWPLAHAIHVPLATNIAATLSAPADLSTLLETNIVANGSLSGLHGGWVSYNPTNNTVTLQPTSPFEHGEVVNVVLTAGIESAGGSALYPISWSFTAATEGRSGEFLTADSYATEVRPIALCAADLDDDDDVDLVAANYDSHTISVLKGNGDGTFAPQVTWPTGGNNPHGLVAADVDRDHDVDVISANYAGSSITVFRNTGTAQFVVRNDYSVPGGPESVCAGDFNDDGHLDLATANLASDQISVLQNHGNGTFSITSSRDAGNNPIFITCGDLSGDGYPDLVTANLLSNDISVFLNKGTGFFAPKVDIPVGNGANSVYPADLDKDGDLDLVAAAGTGNLVAVIFNNGDGTFGRTDTYATGAGPYVGLPSDVDGDQDLDLIHTNANSNNIWVRLNDGTGVFGGETAFATSSHPNALVAADFDEDGSLDLATANRYGDDVSVLLNDAVLTGAEVHPITVGTALGPNVPNPFNPSTRIDYTVRRDGPVKLDVYNARGQHIVTLFDGYRSAGNWSAHWNGRAASGARVASGVYICRLSAGEVKTMKMVLIE